MHLVRLVGLHERQLAHAVHREGGVDGAVQARTRNQVGEGADVVEGVVRQEHPI